MTQQQKYLEGARRRLETKALDYARMEKFGIYIGDNGEKVSVCRTDMGMYIDSMARDLLRAAVDLLQELTLTELPERADDGK